MRNRMLFAKKTIISTAVQNDILPSSRIESRTAEAISWYAIPTSITMKIDETRLRRSLRRRAAEFSVTGVDSDGG